MDGNTWESMTPLRLTCALQYPFLYGYGLMEAMCKFCVNGCVMIRKHYARLGTFQRETDSPFRGMVPRKGHKKLGGRLGFVQILCIFPVNPSRYGCG